jgi:hypothetical protein
MIMTEIGMWHHNPENKNKVMIDCTSVVTIQRKEKKSLLMNQGMTNEKLLSDFHVYVKDRDGSIRC